MHELTCHVHTTQQKQNLFRGHVKDRINRHLLYIAIKSHHVVKWTEIRLYLLKIYCDKGVNSTQHLILKLIITTCKQKKVYKKKKPKQKQNKKQKQKKNPKQNNKAHILMLGSETTGLIFYLIT